MSIAHHRLSFNKSNTDKNINRVWAVRSARPVTRLQVGHGPPEQLFIAQLLPLVAVPHALLLMTTLSSVTHLFPRCASTSLARQPLGINNYHRKCW